MQARPETQPLPQCTRVLLQMNTTDWHPWLAALPCPQVTFAFQAVAQHRILLESSAGILTDQTFKHIDKVAGCQFIRVQCGVQQMGQQAILERYPLRLEVDGHRQQIVVQYVRIGQPIGQAHIPPLRQDQPGCHLLKGRRQVNLLREVAQPGKVRFRADPDLDVSAGPGYQRQRMARLHIVFVARHQEHILGWRVIQTADVVNR